MESDAHREIEEVMNRARTSVEESTQIKAQVATLDKEKSKTEIPPGFKIASIKCKSSNMLSKEECRNIVSDRVKDLEKEDVRMKEAIDQEKILE